MSDLKPCPFCSGKADSRKHSGGFVSCGECSAEIDSPEEWNTRTDSAELARLRAENERLRKALERELGRLQSLSRIQTHYEGCDGSQGHAICYAMRLIREALEGKPCA